MKFLRYFLPLLLLQAAAHAQPRKIVINEPGEARMKLTESKYDFGVIPEGKMATHVFEFTNTGTASLVIEKVQTPCSCTSPTYSQEPVAPGAKGTITIQFNSSGKPGAFSKTVRVVYNSEQSPELITIEGSVLR
jgi:hypothetical protein